MANPNFKLPKDPQRRKQVSTYVTNNGRDAYKTAGSKGGRNSPTRWTSETGRLAAFRMHEIRRQKLAESSREVQNERNTSKN